jgi:hypothetical protein
VDVAQLIGAQLRTDLADQYRPETGANETADGRCGTEETVCPTAEDETEGKEFERISVFDRADIIPKIV